MSGSKRQPCCRPGARGGLPCRSAAWSCWNVGHKDQTPHRRLPVWATGQKKKIRLSLRSLGWPTLSISLQLWLGLSQPRHTLSACLWLGENQADICWYNTRSCLQEVKWPSPQPKIEILSCINFSVSLVVWKARYIIWHVINLAHKESFPLSKFF